MSIWNWVRQFRHEVYNGDDSSRIEMVELYDDGMQHMSTTPDQTLSMLMQSRRLAEQLGERRWKLFIDHWRLQVLLYHKYDIQGALDLATRAVVEAAKPEFSDFPQRVCLNEDLISAYIAIDPEGYANEIQKALDYMERELTPGVECRHCLEGCRTTFALDRDRREEAQDSALCALDLADNDGIALHTASACSNLCIISYRNGNVEPIRLLSEVGEDMSTQANRPQNVAMFRLWKAFVARTQNNESTAKQLHQTAQLQMSRLESLPNEAYFTALCAYLEVGGELEASLKERDRQLQVLAPTNQPAQEARVHLERLKLLLRLDAMKEADLEAARSIAKKLKKPEGYLAKIDEIAEG